MVHTFDRWISKLVESILAIQGSGERYTLALCIHGSFETNQNIGAEGGGGYWSTLLTLGSRNWFDQSWQFKALLKDTGLGFPYTVPLKQTKTVVQREGADNRAHF